MGLGRKRRILDGGVGGVDVIQLVKVSYVVYL